MPNLDIVRRFDTWDSMVDYTLHPDCNTSGKGYSTTDTPEWCGTSTWEEAVELARSGYNAPLPEINRLSDEIQYNIGTGLMNSFETTYDSSGAEVDIGRYVSNDPDCMIEAVPVRISKVGRVITILISGSYSAGTDLAAHSKRGAAIVSLIDTLERLQHSCEIWLQNTVFAESMRMNRFTTLVRLKAPEEPVDIPKLAFAIMHPASLRRVIFNVEDQESDTICATFGFRYKGLGNYGYPARTEEDDLHLADELGATVLLPNNNVLGQDPQAWVLGTLQKVGLDLGDINDN